MLETEGIVEAAEGHSVRVNVARAIDVAHEGLLVDVRASCACSSDACTHIHTHTHIYTHIYTHACTRAHVHAREHALRTLACPNYQ